MNTHSVRAKDAAWWVVIGEDGRWVTGSGTRFPDDFPLPLPDGAVFYRQDTHKWYYRDDAISSWSELAGGAPSGSLTVRELDGIPSLVADTLIFDQTDGLVVTDLGSGDARVDLVSVPMDRIEGLSAALDTLSNRISANSGVGGGGSVTSTEVSAGDAAVSAQAASALSVQKARLDTVSVKTFVKGGAFPTNSAEGLQTVINTISNMLSVVYDDYVARYDNLSTRISTTLSVAQAWITPVNAISDLLSALTSAHNALSNRVSANSGAGGSGSVTSNELSAAAAALSVRTDSVWNAVSNLISAGGGGTSVTSQELSVAAAALSARIDTQSQGVSVLSQALSALEVRVSTASAAAAAAEIHASAASAAATSVDARVNTVSNQVSVLSQLHSVLSQLVSTIETRVSTVSTAAALASNAASNALSVANDARSIGNAASNAVSNEASIRSVAVNVLSNLLSDLISAHNVLSNRVSANSGVGGGGGSVTSTEVSAAAAAVSAQAASALSQALSVGSVSYANLSNAISNLQSVFNAGNISNLISMANVLSNQLSVLSNNLSAISVNAASLSNAVSAAGGFQQVSRSHSAMNLMSGNTLSDIASMGPISMAGSAVYQIEGALIWEAATSGGMAFGVSLPALAPGGSYIKMQANSAAAGQNTAIGGIAPGFVVMSAVAAGRTAVISVSVATINQMKYLEITGMVATSVAGTMRLMAKTSVAGASMSVRSGFLRALRVG